MITPKDNRGGDRPTAPQNNPMNINPMGGNGQSGMNTDYTGFAYGQNKAVNEQRIAGNAAITASEQKQTPAAATYRDWETDRKSTRLNSSHRL